MRALVFRLRRSLCGKGYYLVVSGCSQPAISTVGYFNLSRRVFYFHFRRYGWFLRHGAVSSRAAAKVLTLFSEWRFVNSIVDASAR